MKPLRLPALIALAALLGGCFERPLLPPSGEGVLRGVLPLPPATYGVVLEVQSVARVDSLHAGYGHTPVLLPERQGPAYQAVLLSSTPLPELLPVRLFTQDVAASSVIRIVQTADFDGSVAGGTRAVPLLR
jgi:hypothetical protein